MQSLNLKPTHKLVKSYYETLGQLGQLNFDHEGAVRGAFQALLKGCGRQFDWELIAEYQIAKPKARPIRVDGAMVDTFRLARGFWEAKDEHDDLEKEIRAKFDKGYPKSNIIFQAPDKAVLFQNGVRQGLNEDPRDDKNLVELLKVFFAYREPHHEEWESAVNDFKELIPKLAGAVEQKIEHERKTNKAFVQTFDGFYDLCRQAINPNLSVQAVEKMLVQHLLTERIFRKIFDNPEFARRNVIAAEIEKVIDSLTAKQFSRDAFLKDFDRFYRAIELAAESAQDYSEKQKFISTVYERFFQGFSPKEADTHGIVYTPQPIVDFMVRSVEDILQKEFGRSLSDKGVHILDPFVGTGNFITRVMKEIKTTALPYKYENELHCNEVMLLPYYVASMNIEHEYMERTGEYKPFPGICLVDTFELAEPEQSTLSFMTEENTARVKRQKDAPIFVVIANPPYNIGQTNENDNNKNRKYPVVDRRVAETFAKESKATNKNALSDAYVKAFRWAIDRIGEDGIVAFISNNGFLDGVAFDGLRKALERQFTAIYHVDLKGNARTAGERRRREGGNVFSDAIRVGVGITILVRNSGAQEQEIGVYKVGDYIAAEEKLGELGKLGSYNSVPWSFCVPSRSSFWEVLGASDDYHDAPALTDLFQVHSRGVATCRDTWAYNYSRGELKQNVMKTIAAFNAEVDRWARSSRTEPVDSFVQYDDRLLSWSRDLKADLSRFRYAEFSDKKVRSAAYRPFTSTFLFLDRVLNEEVYSVPKLFPSEASESENKAVSVLVYGRREFAALVLGQPADLNFYGDPQQMFAFYTYDENGSNRRENITDWALKEFRTHYHDANITKWDIFHYVYAVLHHPTYRERYATNLKRELPRIPFVGRAGLQAGVNAVSSDLSNLPKASAQPGSPSRAVFARDGVEEPQAERSKRDSSSRAEALPQDDIKNGTAGRGAEAPLYQTDAGVFWAFADAGRRLAELHVDYEKQAEYPLERAEKGQLDWRVEKMRLSKDKTTLVYNEFLTLKGIPPETCEYRMATGRRWSGSSTNIRSQPTSAAALPTIPTARTTRSTSCGLSGRSSPSAWRR
jgi:predicted helicase